MAIFIHLSLEISAMMDILMETRGGGVVQDQSSVLVIGYVNFRLLGLYSLIGVHADKLEIYIVWQLNRASIHRN